MSLWRAFGVKAKEEAEPSPGACHELQEAPGEETRSCMRVSECERARTEGAAPSHGDRVGTYGLRWERPRRVPVRRIGAPSVEAGGLRIFAFEAS